MKRSDDVSKNTDDLLEFNVDARTIKRSAAHSVILQFIFKMKGIVTMPIITYYLVPEELGTFRLITLAATMLTPIFCMNLINGPGIYFVQEKSKDKIVEMYNTMINSIILIALLLSGVFWVAMKYFGGDYHQYTFLILLVVFSSLVFHAFSVILILFQKTSILVRRNLIKDILATVLSVGLVIAGFSYKGMLFAEIFSSIVLGLSMYYFTRSALPYKLQINTDILIKFLKFSLPLLPVFFFSWIIDSLDTYFITLFLGLGEVGKYGVVYNISSIVLILTYALNLFWFPVSARLWVENRPKYQEMFRMVFSGFTVVLFAGVLLFELNARAIMHIMVRKAEYHDAYYIMGIIAFALSMRVLITLLTAPLYSNKNTKLILFSYMGGGLTNAVLNYLMIPEFGIKGAAISTAISYSLVVLVMSYQNYKTCNFRFFEKRLIYVCGFFAISWLGICELRTYFQPFQVLYLNIPFLVLISAIIYFTVLNKKEKTYLCQLVKETRNRFSF